MRIVVLFLCLLLSAAVAAQPKGHWERVNTENKYDPPQIAQRYRTREFCQGTSADGKIEGSHTVYFDEHKQSLLKDMAVRLSWTPPPAQARPGSTWDGGYQGVIIKDYIVAESYRRTYTLRVDTSHKFVEATSRAGIGYHNQPVGYFLSNDPKANEPTRTALFTFPDPSPSSKQIYLVVQVNLLAWVAGGDTYNYYYKWVSDAPKEVTGQFRCSARNSHNGVVSGLVLRFKNLETGKPLEFTTQKDGEIKKSVRVVTSSGSIRLRLEGVDITPQTRYEIPMEGLFASFVYPGKKLSLPLKGDYEMNEKNGFRAEVPLKIPLFKLTVLALKWDIALDKWQRCASNILIRTVQGGKLLQAGSDAFKGSGDTLALDLYLPTSELLQQNKLTVYGYEPVDKYTDSRSTSIPKAGSVTGSTIVSLQLCDTTARIARLKYQIFQYFLPFLGEQRARQVANLNINLNSTYSSICYLDGTMHLPGSIDLNQDEFSETMMHEWTHHLMSIVGSDPDVEAKLGGRHDVWTVAPTPELAWDEARAHFCSVVLTRGLKVPYNPNSFSLKSAVGPTNSSPTAGDNVEGVIAVALIDLYASSGYTKTQDVMRNFLAVNDHAIATLGHPPRTSSEFFQVQKQWTSAQMSSGSLNQATGSKMLQMTDKISQKYKISP